jgi:hypothetical protein
MKKNLILCLIVSCVILTGCKTQRGIIIIPDTGKVTQLENGDYLVPKARMLEILDKLNAYEASLEEQDRNRNKNK